jgi:hypothetical protein
MEKIGLPPPFPLTADEAAFRLPPPSYEDVSSHFLSQFDNLLWSFHNQNTITLHINKFYLLVNIKIILV